MGFGDPVIVPHRDDWTSSQLAIALETQDEMFLALMPIAFEAGEWSELSRQLIHRHTYTAECLRRVKEGRSSYHDVLSTHQINRVFFEQLRLSTAAAMQWDKTQ